MFLSVSKKFHGVSIDSLGYGNLLFGMYKWVIDFLDICVPLTLTNDLSQNVTFIEKPISRKWLLTLRWMLFKIDIRNSLTETFYCDSFSRFFEVSFYGSTTMSLDLVPNPSVVPTSVEARHIYPQQHSNHQSVEHFPPSHLDDQVLISLMITVNSVSMVIMRAGPTY